MGFCNFHEPYLPNSYTKFCYPDDKSFNFCLKEFTLCLKKVYYGLRRSKTDDYLRNSLGDTPNSRVNSRLK
jgi:hypothetical protein